ncbi:MAG: indolepyruvate ferredoxin oxidoreductase subunit beta [Methanocalculus sp. MSAO_Arc1]|uniref:indolepyruvate oxidoreductase subunit beta n=1 Tax=Methanocalculus TaxID=71151 RepID=UPI000FF1B489|nr:MULTISPECIES: indolepyruvate oxidoreductase subunit beta [unclassified Methanocalculus]MCP1662594.1 indolepyruvate ferredoxin oxidoreductase beta subunit [Methanocalculus sp. AMF5]RQD78951.1 MAG: indolepyruvate ferredoxin oxidoreductase subunit beta [Methanocalculus sp. MSAO_Arc1]
MNPGFDIMIVGIGGQGTILASNVLGEACLIEGRSVRGAETHGMAQRGGSVESQIRIGGIHGPLIVPGTADLLIAFDLLEAVRYRHFLKPGRKMIVNSQLVLPTSAFTSEQAILTAADITDMLSGPETTIVDATAIATAAGSPLAANIALLGAASHAIPLDTESLLEGVRRCVPQKTIAINEQAFLDGRAVLQP